MTILICGLGVLMAGASVITAYAALTAQDGYEDEFGFHQVSTVSKGAVESDKKSVEENLPPFAPAS